MFQNSDELALQEVQDAEKEQRRLLFVYLLRRAYVESGLNRLSQPQLKERGLDPGAFYRSTSERKDVYQHPRYETLFRWCRLMYKHAGKREDTAKYEDLMRLAGYAIPSEVNAAMRRTTQELAIQRNPSTDTLPQTGLISYSSPTQDGTSRQFKKPLGKRL